MPNEMMNSEIDFLTRANSKLNPVDPKSGIFIIGNKGIEFRAEKTKGFIQIPWSSIISIRVQLFFAGKYVRGFFIETNENQHLEFIVSDAKTALQQMRKYLHRDQFTANKSNFSSMFKRLKNK